MTIKEFLDKVIEMGKEGARTSYGERTDDNGKAMLAGSLEGFEACRDKTPEQLFVLLQEEQQKTREHRAHFGFSLRQEEQNRGEPTTAERKEQTRLYWHQRCREAEIEWVANCVSAALVNSGYQPIVSVTARGMLAAAKILGVRGETPVVPG